MSQSPCAQWKGTSVSPGNLGPSGPICGKFPAAVSVCSTSVPAVQAVLDGLIWIPAPKWVPKNVGRTLPITFTTEIPSTIIASSQCRTAARSEGSWAWE